MYELLTRWARHVDGDDLALTGGVALEQVLRGSRARVADVDFVARRMDAVSPSVTREFLVSHRHLPPDKPILQLVDPKTRLRIDVFPDRLGSVARARRSDVAGVSLLVVAPADLLAHKLELLAKPVDPKHWRDAVALSQLCGVAPPPEPASSPPDVYCTDLAYRCARCERAHSAEFPIADTRAIFDILGYV